MSRQVLKVVVTGASGDLGLILSHMVSTGDLFGLDQWMDLVLVEHAPKLKQVKVGVLPELMTCNARLVRKFSCTSSMDQAFTDADVIFLASGTPPSQGLSRNDIIGTNALEYREVGQALNRVAKPSVKIVVIVDPQNTNLAVLSYFTPNLKPSNMTALSRVDHNRASTMIARMLNIANDKVTNMIMWGNRSQEIFPDIRHATVELLGRAMPAYDAVKDDFYLKYKFTEILQNRDADIQKKHKSHTHLTTAVATVQHTRDWLLGTKPGNWTSMIVISDGSYGIEKGLPFSFPIHVTKPGEWEIVQGLDLNYYETDKLMERAMEVKNERHFAYSILQLTEAEASVKEDEEGEVAKAKATTWHFGTADPIPCSVLGPLERERMGAGM
ncbi:malate dehydrogenase, cytoplasmic [Elysia marginata]|uniref:Malate dehydrogenase, cytoplasmic n=1 Tax=Elysia marginata TaxID=1093978 RepID=A0AAV4FS21_9GAST|nr:malate dehydrogenase, cytoplasmic [Elysia marginata]